MSAEASQNLVPALYAEVAVPVRVSRTFTYRLPVRLELDASIGSRAIVPFGKSKQITGYIVSLKRGLENSADNSDIDIKEIEEILDDEPLLIPEILDLTKWVADYYASPWGEVLKAALPPGINAAIDQVLTLTDKGRDYLPGLSGRSAESAAGKILRAVVIESITLKDASNIVGADHAKAALRQLRKDGLISVSHETRTGAVGAKRRKLVRLLASPTESTRKLSDTQERVVRILETRGGKMLFTDLLDEADASGSTIQTLAKRGILEVVVHDVRRDPLANASLPPDLQLDLTEAQQTALSEITQSISEDRFQAFLLHGVTGSGKTEVYIRAMRFALELGRSAMMLVPEIALTPVFSRRLRAHFGDQVSIFHSALSQGERFDEWNRVRRGEARIVIGTRSAVFAPVTNLGIVIVDEEHDGSYRQQDPPYYSGRDTAIMRASKESAAVVLGSATPSLESFHNAKRGKYRYLSLPSRIHDRAMATASLIDMRELAGRTGKPVIFSPELLSAIKETHENNQQSIILLNRRGYSSFVFCRSCGESVQCINCDVTLTFHREDAALICHYCNFRKAKPSKCPACGGVFIFFVGHGTEQIEELLRKEFPTLRLARVDRDTVKRHRSFEETLLRFSAGEIDTLVGTQMLAKGHDFPNVTLVGVVSVDAGLAMPDFRSSERTFQLITQVAGRAGRGALEGRVLIQTFHPEHYALRHACAQDYDGFYEEELNYRRSMNYPPFVVLASLLIHDKSLESAQVLAAEVRRSLDRANSGNACRVLGPAPAPLSRLRGEHRIQILLKSHNRSLLRQTIDAAVVDASARGFSLHSINIEIDPVDLM